MLGISWKEQRINISILELRDCSGVNASSRLGGGRSAEGDGPLPACPGTGRGVWEGQIFCDLEMAYFGDSEVLNLEIF